MHCSKRERFQNHHIQGSLEKIRLLLTQDLSPIECLVGTLERLIQDVNMNYSSVADGTLSVLLVSKEISEAPVGVCPV